MSRSTISTFQLFKIFPDELAARKYLENRLWPAGATRPICKAGERIATREGTRKGDYRCNACKIEFTIRSGTIFERSHVPLHKWLFAMYLLVTARKGISSMQLAKEIGITQKSAWFVLHRLREACGGASRSAVLRYDPANPNSVETFYAVFRRGLYGVYHKASAKHLPRYVNEFAFRLDEGNVRLHTLERLGAFVDAVVGKRITYKELTSPK
jgi:transposase-like protein